MPESKISTLRRRARRLRHDQTEAERKLWARLRDRQLIGAKFRRQHPIGPFIADFCCPERKLVVELDGGQHVTQVETDRRRTAFLVRRGYRVLRFWDNEVITETDAIMQKIAQVVRDSYPKPVSPSPCPLPQRGRG